MATNIGFDNGAPYVEEGADEGRVVQVWDRIAVEPIPTAQTHFTLERSVDNGQTWESVLGDTPSPDGATLIDWESLSYGDTLYRAIAETVEGATAETIITVEARSNAIWLSGGIGYALTCRLPLDPQHDVQAGRATTTKSYAGRSKPVVYKGEALSRVVSIKGTVTDRTIDAESAGATPSELQNLIHNEHDLHMFRSPDGDRIYGAIPGISISRNTVAGHDDPLRPWNAFWGYGFELTEATGA